MSESASELGRAAGCTCMCLCDSTYTCMCAHNRHTYYAEQQSVPAQRGDKGWTWQYHLRTQRTTVLRPRALIRRHYEALAESLPREFPEDMYMRAHPDLSNERESERVREKQPYLRLAMEIGIPTLLSFSTRAYRNSLRLYGRSDQTEELDRFRVREYEIERESEIER